MPKTLEPATVTVEELYESAVKPLPADARLKLATLILNGISPDAVVDDSDEWTEEDLEDFTRATWAHIEEVLPDDDD